MKNGIETDEIMELRVLKKGMSYGRGRRVEKEYKLFKELNTSLVYFSKECRKRR